jgi:hypothetical protein
MLEWSASRNGPVLEICNENKSCYPECQVSDNRESECINVSYLVLCTLHLEQANIL